MAPALHSAVTQSPSTPSKRPKRPVPIIPAIPRSLEKRPKSEKLPPNTEDTSITPITANESNDARDGNTDLSGRGSQSGDSRNLNTTTVHGNILEVSTPIEPFPVLNEQEPSPPLEAVTKPSKDYSSDRDDASELPLTFEERDHPLAPGPSDDREDGKNDDVVRNPSPEPLHTHEDVGSPQAPKAGNHPLRATATSFHSHSSPLNDSMDSRTGSPQKELGLVQSASTFPEQTPPTHATLSPIQTAYHSHSHANSISFYPPPLSSNDPSSPAHSHYQGYTYDPNGYSLHAHSSSHYSHPYQPQFETYVPQERPYSQHASHYDGGPPFSVVGSQPPLTPSATPLAAGPPLHPTLSNLSSAQPEATEGQSRYRSDSHEASSPGHIPPGGSLFIGPRPHPLQQGTYEASQPHATTLDAVYDTPIATNHEQSQLAEHLLYHFNDPEFADCELILTHEKQRFPETRWSLSTIILIRSPTLRELLKSSGPVEAISSGKKVIKLHLNDRFITHESLDSALRVLYGMPPEAFPDSFHAESTETGPESSSIAMRANLAYVSSGNLLALRNVVLQGFQMVAHILSWANVDAALSFALEAGTEKGYDGSSSAAPPLYSTTLPSDSIPSSSSRVVFTPSSSSGLTGQQSENPSSSPSSPENSQRSLPQSAKELLTYCLDFIFYNFSTSWSLDPFARPCADLDRLPVTADSKSPLTKSRLSNIKFGDHPSEAAAKSNDSNILLSSILLSIPFAQLDHLLRSVGEPLARNMPSIVKERERRRQIVVQSKNIPWSERIGSKAQEWVEAGYEEAIETSADGKIWLSRKYTGIGRDPTDEDHVLQ